jgi:hypothetical protein
MIPVRSAQSPKSVACPLFLARPYFLTRPQLLTRAEAPSRWGRASPVRPVFLDQAAVWGEGVRDILPNRCVLSQRRSRGVRP